MTARRHVIRAGSSVGSYKIVKQIGSGGMGKVFEGVHTMLSRHVAIKVLLPELLAAPAMSSRMAQEASILDDLRHPGIVPIFDCGLLDDGRPWIAMELVTGDSLATKMDAQPRLASGEVIALLTHLADVLTTVHARGIIHRDLKPDNILFADPGSAYPLRVIDWGVARQGAAGRFTLEGMTFGTPSYMSPEQILGRDIAPPCDLYSLGVIAYEALAGHLPFEGASLAEMVALHLHATEAPLAPQCPAAPRALCELIHRMLLKVPGQRPTASELRDALRALAIETADPELEFESYVVTVSEVPTPMLPRRAVPHEPPARQAAFPGALVTVRLQPSAAAWAVREEILAAS
ncbi:MAG: serine/threonine protein kinase [Myxococcota bacterium]|nr:serine/threonine protein kinase [Myxococcota bacterium]